MQEMHSYRRNTWWGCLRVTLVVLGAVGAYANIAFGGTDRLPEIRSWVCLAIGVGILLVVVAQRRSKRKATLPSLHPVVALFVVAVSFYLVLF